MHTGLSSIYTVIKRHGWPFFSVIAPVIAIVCCTPNPRFTSGSPKRLMEEVESAPPSTAPAAHAVSATAGAQSDTVASPSQPDSVPKTIVQNPARPLAPDTGALQSSWASAFDEKETAASAASDVGSCIAVWYGPRFHGKKTAGSERFDMNKYTAAHPTLPFNTMAKITNLDNGLSVTVRINDRGPFNKKYCIDLSLAAARKIGLDKSGTARVRIETGQ